MMNVVVVLLAAQLRACVELNFFHIDYIFLKQGIVHFINGVLPNFR